MFRVGDIFLLATPNARFVGELERGLEEVNERVSMLRTASRGPLLRRCLQVAGPNESAHDCTIFLLNPRLIVFAIWARSCELDPLRLAIREQRIIHELARTWR